MSTEQNHLVVDNTMGAAFIGVICAACLYGVSCVQTWFYFNRYSCDVWYIKLLVLVVWIFDSIHQGLISHTVYFYVVTNYDNVSIQAKLVWSILLEVLFNGLIGLLVQSFLTMRVWRLSKENIPLTAITAALVLAEFACSVAFTIRSMKLDTWQDLTKLKGLSMTVNVLGAVADVFIATGLFFFLHRSRTGFKKSDTMISKLIMFSVSTGLLTSICAIASLFSILVWGDTLIYVAFYFSLGRLYSNSLLATLNARQSIRGLTDETGGDLSFSLQIFKSRHHKRDMTANSRSANISIKIDTTHEMVRDRTDRSGEIDSSVTDKSFKDVEKKPMEGYSPSECHNDVV